MDNVVASRAIVDSIQVTCEGALQIQYAKALLAKAVEQQNAGANSQGRVYSRSSGSRAASSGRPCPSFYYSLPIAASAVSIPTTVAPTVGLEPTTTRLRAKYESMHKGQ